MLPNRRTLIPGAILLAVQGCAAVTDAGRPTEALRLLVASPESRVGGEAYYEGTLRIENGCVIVWDGRKALPIFDSSVRLADDGDGLVDMATGRRFRFGDRLSAAAAWLRENDRGWPFSDIEAVVAPNVPGGCDGDTVVRLKRLEPVRPRPSALPS